MFGRVPSLGSEPGAALQNLASQQRRLASTTAHLSSGLRIATAADDPSGNAISQQLSASVAGLDQGSENLQTFSNFADVDNSALATVTHLVARIRSLAIEAASDLNSPSQLAAIQVEIKQLNAEINTVAEGTSFNGFHPLSTTQPQASLTPPTIVQAATGTPSSNAFQKIVSLTAPPTPGNVLVAEFSSGYLFTPPPGWTLVANSQNFANPSASTAVLQTFVHTVVAGDPATYTFLTTAPIPTEHSTATILEVSGADPIDPIDTAIDDDSNFVTGTLLTTPSLTTTEDNQLPLAFFDVPVVPLSAGATGTVTIGGWSEIAISNGSIYRASEVQVGTPTPTGATQQAGFTWSLAIPGSANTALLLVNPAQRQTTVSATVQDGPLEGQVLSVPLTALSSLLIGTANIDVTQTNHALAGLTPGATVTSGAEFAISICDNALAVILTRQAILGAFVTVGQVTNQNNAIASVNETASKSSLTDLDIAQAVSQETRERLQIGISVQVIASIASQRSAILSLFR